MTNKIKIGDTYVGKGFPNYFIAEIGLNHNGSVEIAKQLMLAAKKAGANAAKFQKRNSDLIFTSAMLQSEYKSPHAYGASYGEHRKKLELDEDGYAEIFRYAQEIGIQVFASVWDEASIDFMENFGVHAFKIASADLDNWELIQRVAEKNKPILISTGMSTEKEIKNTIKFVRRLTNKFIFMHCTSDYPAVSTDLNLGFIHKLKEMCGNNPVGYSGHEKDLEPSIIAQVLGASVIERHITFNKESKGSDHSASLLPEEFNELIIRSKELVSMLGTGQKPTVSHSVLQSKRKLGKSLYYSRDLTMGHRLQADDLVAKSPSGGISPSEKDKLLKRKIKRDVNSEEMVLLEDLS